MRSIREWMTWITGFWVRSIRAACDLRCVEDNEWSAIAIAIARRYWYPACLIVEHGADWKQEPLDGDVAVTRLLGDLLGLVEQARGTGREIDLACATAGHLRKLAEHGLDAAQHLARIAAGAIDQARGEPLGVVEQNLQKMFGGKLLMALAKRERLRGLHETARTVGVFVDIHAPLPGPNAAPLSGPRLSTRRSRM